ncbi:MAG: SHOCT domain-containing protein [Conexibacteraceae bacterium]|nr:SHOCT domain-containing protein [Conexibacteraceae bacterium]
MDVKDPARPRRERARLVNALIVLATTLLVVAIFATWANRLLFSPDNWSSTSTQLLQNANVRTTTANYIVDQVYAYVNVPGLIKKGLPSQFQGIAGPASGALRDVAVQRVGQLLTQPHIQSLWARANRVAAQTFIAVVNGGKGAVGTRQGVVTLDLGSIADSAASQLGLLSGPISKLPPNIATVTLFKSDKLSFVQDIGRAIKGLALWLTILVPMLYALAIALTPSPRRRTLMKVGFAGLFAGAAVLLLRLIMESQVAGALTDSASLKVTIRDVYAIATAILRDVAGAVIAGGIVLIVAAWFAGPARAARLGREAIAPFLREHRGGTYAITLGLMVLIFLWDPISATSKPAGIIVFTLLALLGTEVLVRQTAREFPEARTGAATHVIRTRLHSLRARRPQRSSRSASAPAGPTTAEQLGQLADLRAQGALSEDEYQAAKTRLLRG